MASTSVLAQWQVMKDVAGAGVRVVLDGQGADELLGGYPALIGAHLADLCRTGAWRRAVREGRAAHAAGLGSLPSLIGRACLEPLPRRCAPCSRAWCNVSSTAFTPTSPATGVPRPARRGAAVPTP